MSGVLECMLTVTTMWVWRGISDVGTGEDFLVSTVAAGQSVIAAGERGGAGGGERTRPQQERQEGSQARQGWGGRGRGGGRGDGEMTLTGGPGLPSKPEAPWTKGNGLTQRKGREGAGERKRETTGRGEVSRA